MKAVWVFRDEHNNVQTLLLFSSYKKASKWITQIIREYQADGITLTMADENCAYNDLHKVYISLQKETVL